MGQTAFVEDVSYQRDFDFFFPSQARSSLTAHITDIIAIGMAFAHCYLLEAVELPSSLKSIGSMAFFDNPLTEVTSRILNPFDISEDVFEYNNGSSPAVLYVPQGTKSKYENCTGWNNFSNVIEEKNLANGDADGDGKVTMTDVITVFSVILGETPENFDPSAVDMNGDGIVTVTDILLLQNEYNLKP